MHQNDQLYVCRNGRERIGTVKHNSLSLFCELYTHHRCPPVQGVARCYFLISMRRGKQCCAEVPGLMVTPVASEPQRSVTLCHLGHESHNYCRLSHNARVLWRPPGSEPTPRPSDWVTPSVIPQQIHHCHQPGTPFNNLFRNSNSDTRFLPKWISSLTWPNLLSACKCVAVERCRQTD